MKNKNCITVLLILIFIFSVFNIYSIDDFLKNLLRSISIGNNIKVKNEKDVTVDIEKFRILFDSLEFKKKDIDHPAGYVYDVYLKYYIEIDSDEYLIQFYKYNFSKYFYMKVRFKSKNLYYGGIDTKNVLDKIYIENKKK